MPSPYRVVKGKQSATGGNPSGAAAPPPFDKGGRGGGVSIRLCAGRTVESGNRKSQPCGLVLGRERFTFHAPHKSSNRIRCSDGFCFCFYGGYGAVETIAGFAYEAVVDFDEHDVSR